MGVGRYLLGSSLVMLLAACGRAELPLGEGAFDPDENDSGGGASGTSGGGTSAGGSTSGGGTGAGGGTSGGGGQSASGGSAGTGGGNGDECQPTAEICYGNRPASSPGNECLANIDNTGATRVQFRQTWARDVAPIGLTLSFWHPLRAARTSLSLVECHSRGLGGEILISSWDRSNPDITRQTLTSGFASYVVTRPATPELIDQGLCFADFSYRYSGPAEATDIAVDRWSDLTGAQPWSVAPTVYRRVSSDFAAETVFNGTSQGDSRVFIDENTGHMHSFTPRMMFAALGNSSSGEGFAVPMYAVETKWWFNDGTFNCMGRFRSNDLKQDRGCGLRDGDEREQPQWGCQFDAPCPPDSRLKSTTSDTAGPGYTTGFVLIVDLERVFSSAFNATLCVLYTGRPEQTMVAEGWAAEHPNPSGYRYTCRGAPKWNPDLPDDAGLPMGDWCSRTNAPATATCHDAYRRVFYSAAQAFKVREGTCPVTP